MAELKPDCAVCGRPYYQHNGAFCPIFGTYRPATRPPASGVAEELRELLGEACRRLRDRKRAGMATEEELALFEKINAALAQALGEQDNGEGDDGG